MDNSDTRPLTSVMISVLIYIVKYPDLSGNIPLKPSYGVYTSQLVKYCDINQSSSGFVSDVKDIMTSCFLNFSFS